MVTETQIRTSLMFKAIEEDAPDTLSRLLEAGGDPNTTEEGETLLTWAVYEERMDMISLLLDVGADLEGTSDCGTALVSAAATGNMAIVRLLLDAGAEVEAHEKGGSTALLEAVNTRNIEITRLLLGLGAQANVCARELRDESGELSPIMLAAQDGDVAIGRLLLEYGADPNRFETLEHYTALHYVADTSAEFCELLIDYGANVHAQLFCLGCSDTPLDIALGADEECSRVLFRESERMAPGAFGLPVHAAAYLGDLPALDVASLMVLDASGRTPLHWVVGKQKDVLARCILDAAGQGTSQASRSLSGQQATMSFLIAHGADKNAKDSGQRTPLVESLHWGQLCAARWLLENGADVNFADSAGWVALHLAALGGHLDLMEMLLDRGSDIDCARLGTWTPLTFALHGKQTAAVALLLEHGASLSASGYPLHRAISNGLIRAAELLIQYGVDLTVDEEGNTPLQLARQQGNHKLISLLEPSLP